MSSPNTLDAATQKSLQNALYAYIQTYGGESLAEARAIAGSLLSVKEKAGELKGQGWAIEQWVDDLVSDLDFHQISTQTWTPAEHLLATQAKNWRETLEVKTRATLDAYIQKYAPELNPQKIEQLITTVLPIVEDATITRDEARHLIATVSEQLDVSSAIERAIDPKWLLFADKTQQVLQHQDLEASATEVLNAYVHKFQPTAVEIGAGLVEQAVEAVFNSQLKLGLDVNLDPETRQLLVQQVMLKFRLSEASPSPSKTALEIAQQLHDEVSRYRRDRGLDDPSYLPTVTSTDDTSDRSLLGGEMSIGIDLKPSHQPDTPTSHDSSGNA